jgi:nucleoside phosphorylase
MLRGTPFLAVKSITDLMDGGQPTQDEFMANLETASARLTEELVRVIAWLVDHPTM